MKLPSRRRLRLLALALLVPCLGTAAAAASAEPGIRLLHADARGVSFEVEAGLPIVVPIPGAVEYSDVRLDGFAPTGGEGEPALPARTVWLGVPEGASITVEASAVESRGFAGVRLAPRLLSREDEGAAGRSDLGAQLDALRASPAYFAARLDAPLARVARLGGLRSQRVAAIEIRPARYDARAGQLEVATRIVVHVAFAGRSARAAATPFEPAFEDLYRDLLLNHESARGFRRRTGGTSLASGHGERATTTGFDAATMWVRVRVARKGIQEIRGEDLEAAGINLETVVPATLRLFTRPGLPLLPEDSVCDTCGLAEVAVLIEGGEDGRLDATDRLVFFGLGASGWQDDYTGPGASPAEWLDHPYETHNVYWLALDATGATAPQRWNTRDVAPTRPGAWPAPHGPARLHFEANLQYVNDLYEPGLPWDQWVWRRIQSQQGPVALVADATGAVAEEPARVRARLWGRRIPGYFGSHQLTAQFNDRPLAPLSWYGSARQDVDSTATWIADGANRLWLSLATPPPPASRDEVVLQFWELHFARRFEAVDDTLEFESTGPAGPVDYRLAPFSDTSPGAFLLLDVSDPLQPVELTGWAAADTAGGRAIRFHDERPRGFYFAATAAARHRPTIERAAVRDIRHGGADYLVICSDDLEGEAQRLAAHRRSTPPFPGATTAVVRISDILAWYGGGRMDPVAIRNFLHEAVTGGRWAPAPSYACLLGDASYDYKEVYAVGEPGLARHQVPTFVHNAWIYTYSSDDWLVDLDVPAGEFPPAGGIPDLITGRLPAASPAEAAILVDKVIAYDATPEFGDWRNRTLFLVDDMMQGSQPDPLSTEHIRQSDLLEHEHLPGWLDRAKVHLVEYPFTSGFVKDGARQELLAQLERGAVFWHYIGHANPFKLADENAFVLTDVATLTNGPRLPFFFAAACDVAPFDAPFITALGEALVKRPGGGTIASFAGTINTFSFANLDLGRSLYDALLHSPDQGGARTIGEAAFVVKHRGTAQENDRNYHILGDPGMRLGTPRHDVRLKMFDDATGEALADSLPRGRRIRLVGEVHATRDPAREELLATLGGTAHVTVTDAPPRPTIAGVFRETSYDANPRTLFAGTVPVVGGRLEARFVVPVEAAAGAGARASVYVAGLDTDGSGARTAHIVDGEASPADSAGPVAEVRFASGGDVVGSGEEAVVTLTDESGIRTLVESPLDHVAIAVDDGVPVDLTAQFRYDPGSFRRGMVRFPLPLLGDGEHTLTVFASDNLAASGTRPQHRSRTTIAFRVAEIVQSADVRAWALPNPFLATAGTHLVFTGFAGSSRAQVRIHDVSGRLVRRLVGDSDAGHVQVRWDGRDDAGRAVAAGVYLYRAVVKPAAGGESGFTGRLVLLR